MVKRATQRSDEVEDSHTDVDCNVTDVVRAPPEGDPENTGTAM